MEQEATFGWSNLYRAFLLIILLIPFADIFIQLFLGNWIWFAISVFFAVVILLMIAFSYIKPFIRLSDGVLRFYLVPIAPVVFQRIRIDEISSYYAGKGKISVSLKNGKIAGVNLYMIDPADREKFLAYLNNIIFTNKSQPIHN